MSTRLTAAAVALAALLLIGAANAASPLRLGPETHMRIAVYHGYYDGHKDGYVITDVSNKAQASMWHVNFAPIIKGAKNAPPQYFFTGRAATGQLAVFGSEPGDATYNPLWDELFVTWKAGVTPTLVVSDTQIDSLKKAGKLTVSDPHIVHNAPITSVGSKPTLGYGK
jgi:hypothetical protein